MSESSSDLSSDCDVPERRRKRGEAKPRSKSKEQKKKDKKKRKKKATGESQNISRSKKGSSARNKGRSGERYRPPASRVANPDRVRYERQREKQHLAEFSRNYGDSSDEERPTLRKQRIRELKSRLANLEGDGGSSRLPRKHRVNNRNTNRSSKSPGKYTRDGREGGSRKGTTPSSNKNKHRNTRPTREHYRVRRSQGPSRGGDYYSRQSSEMESFDNAALQLLNQTARKLNPNSDQDPYKDHKKAQRDGDGGGFYEPKPSYPQQQNPGSEKGGRVYKKKHLSSASKADDADVKAMPRSNEEQRRKNKKKEKKKASANATTAAATATTKGPTTKRDRANVMFSLLKAYNRIHKKNGTSGNGGEGESDFSRAAANAIPVKGGSIPSSAPNGKDSRRRRSPQTTDHQKLFETARQMEVRLKELGQQGWGDHQQEATALRSDLRDVYVDLVMRAPEYALLKNVVLRVWMTFYHDIQRLKTAIRRYNKQQQQQQQQQQQEQQRHRRGVQPVATDAGRDTLHRHIYEGSKFFRGFVECVCVRFNLYPAEAGGGSEQTYLRDIMREQYGEIKSKDTSRDITVCRIVAEIYIALGDLERYRTLLISDSPKAPAGGGRGRGSRGSRGRQKREEEKAAAVRRMVTRKKAVFYERARALYKLAAQTCPGYGKAHNQMAMVSTSDDLEVIFQYMMSTEALEPFPARENLLAAFESSRKRFVALVASGGVRMVSSLPTGIALARFAVLLARLGGVLFTKINLDDAERLFTQCLESFHYCLEAGAITDGVLIRVAILCIVLAQNGRLPQNHPFQYQAEMDATDPHHHQKHHDEHLRSNGVIAGYNAMSVVTLRAMDLIFEFFGAAMRRCAGNLNSLKYLAPISALSLWLSYNGFSVNQAPDTDRKAFFTTSLARLANALQKMRRTRARVNSAALDLISGFAPLGNLEEFSNKPRAASLQPLSTKIDSIGEEEGGGEEGQGESVVAVPLQPEGAWMASEGCAQITVGNNGKSASSRKLTRWQTVISSSVVEVLEEAEEEEEGGGVSEKEENSGSGSGCGDALILEQLRTSDNNFAVVVGVVPDSFPSDARLPIGWKVPGFGLICGTGETLGSQKGGATAYAQTPIQQGDEIGFRLRRTKNSDNEGTLEFIRNGSSMGCAFTGVDLSERYRIAASLIKTQTVGLVASGHAKRAAAAAEKEQKKKRKKKEEGAAQSQKQQQQHQQPGHDYFTLKWQIRATLKAARAVLFKDAKTNRFVTVQPEPHHQEQGLEEEGGATTENNANGVGSSGSKSSVVSDEKRVVEARSRGTDDERKQKPEASASRLLDDKNISVNEKVQSKEGEEPAVVVDVSSQDKKAAATTSSAAAPTTSTIANTTTTTSSSSSSSSSSTTTKPTASVADKKDISDDNKSSTSLAAPAATNSDGGADHATSASSSAQEQQQLLLLRGKAGVMNFKGENTDDLVAMARARAARAREQVRRTQLVDEIMTQTLKNKDKSGADAKDTGTAADAVAEASNKNLLVLDLPNICLRHGNHKRFSCEGVQLAIDHFRKKGFTRMVAFLPEYLLDYEHASKHRHLIRLGLETEKKVKTKLPDNISLLLSLKEEGYVIPTPAQDYDDSYCIEYAHKHGGVVVTNDRYRDCIIEGVTKSWLREHLMTFTFVNDEFLPNPDFTFR